MTEKLYKVMVSHPEPKYTQRRLEAPEGAEGYYRRDVSSDGRVITYTRVA